MPDGLEERTGVCILLPHINILINLLLIVEPKT